MSSKKKITQSVETTTTPPPVRKNYFLFSPDTQHSSAVYTQNRVFITHTEYAYVEIIDTGSGYHIKDVSPLGGTKIYDVDYSLAADLFAALKIFYHNADKINGEYWTVFQGNKI
jgi:hypothetical protein